MSDILRFKTPCGHEFNGNTEDHWSGNVITYRKIQGDHPFDSEYLEESKLDGFAFSDECNNCKRERRLIDHYVAHFSYGKLYDVKEILCKATLIDAPHPLVCPITGDKLHCYAEGDSGEALPVYIDSHGKLRTKLSWCDFTQDIGVRFLYREIDNVDDECIQFKDTHMSVIYPKSKENLDKMLEFMLEESKKNPRLYDSVKFLINVLDGWER